MVEPSHSDLKNLGAWFEKIVLSNEWRLFQAIENERIMGLLSEVLNDEDEKPFKNSHKRGRVAGMQYMASRPHELIELYGTNGTEKEDSSGPEE